VFAALDSCRGFKPRSIILFLIGREGGGGGSRVHDAGPVIRRNFDLEVWTGGRRCDCIEIDRVDCRRAVLEFESINGAVAFIRRLRCCNVLNFRRDLK
jgi:hypothetical protein